MDKLQKRKHTCKNTLLRRIQGIRLYTHCKGQGRSTQETSLLRQRIQNGA